MLKYLLIIGILLKSIFSNAQIIYWQETLHGGTSVAGITNMGGDGVGYFNIHYPIGSTIKKAFLIAANFGSPFDININLNNQNFSFSSSLQATNKFFNHIQNIDTIKDSYLDILEITDFALTQSENYQITLPFQSEPDNSSGFGYYTHFFLWILYENDTMPLTTSALVLNQQNVSPVWTYSIDNIPSIDNSYPVGLTFIGSVFNFLEDGTYVVVNEQNFGLCYGSDWNALEFFSPTSGTSGSYFYENNNLFGLGDDTADDTVNDADALVDIKSSLINGVDSMKIQFPHYSAVGDSATYYGALTNQVWFFALAYTPYECEVLPVNVTSDTAICLGSSVTLTAGGGTDYFWQSSMGSLGVLDSTANSITVSPTTTTSYTVRIEAEGFCPEVRPVQVVVHKIPEPQITSTTSTCGDAVGNIEVTFPYCFCDEFSVAFNNQNPTLKDTALSPINFSNLPTGVYPITITDNIGCSWSGSIFVADTNITVAAFTVEPSSGIEPLQVNLNNNSNHATNYEWSINGEITFDENPTFDTAGFYNIQLIAYNNLPECADTAQFTLFVEPAFEVAVPNVFSPNNDGKNDAFIIDFSRVTSFTIAIYNRWGQQVHSLSKEIADLKKESILIWDGKNAADGIYYYTLQVNNNYKNYAYRRQPKFKELNGTITLVR